MADDDSDLEILDSLPDHINNDRRSVPPRRRRPANPSEFDSLWDRGPRRTRESARDLPGMNERRRQRLQQDAMQHLSRQSDAARHRPQDVDVIDLTDEPDNVPPAAVPLTLPRVVPDSNGMPARRNVGFLDVVNNPSQQPDHSRNPRRQQSGLARTPSLSRSDPSLSFGRGRSAIPAQMHIDLTEDDDVPSITGPAAGQQARYATRGSMLDPPANRTWHWPRPGGAVHSVLGMFLGLGGNASRNAGAPADAAGGAAGNHRLREIRDIQQELERTMELNQLMQNRPRDMLIELDYGGLPPNFWDDHTPNRPKPAYVPPPDAPVGFTRDTGDEVVAICPGCDEELVYDPDEVRDEPEAVSTKKPRTKKDRAEHHFMAIKACGHVYCRVCYERRTTPSSRKGGSGPGPNFRQLQDSTKLLCAVDDCASEIKSKTAWLGIFV
ncbi:hypothetical protein MCOR27_010332 [Pyricularia oryzae]|uniref:RING-type domain-containing protein n=2 Tax=Pyricularia TaxID=48558 RepID=A0ABQ8NVN0_PYRGI|nr:hypothetical protein MCOR01_004480 [Pyricularia oryzae]KAI6302748.1 hypothetical protein MCOR33_002017 [Pyricularia grisea]KAH9431162.1 hypothetical protein MCOR02_008467 [Pyricularia oryzae]KAI6253359.1 hypothetical protein MCOR19_010085 [Pyricularia oryzae]KAI6264568.1 hypothetical protein MCOR26_011259 [Pyricularia oryzae]